MLRPECLEFGPYRLDRRVRSLTREGQEIPLHGRALDLLYALAAADGEMVTKDDLLQRVWPGLTVDENNLHQQVSALRKALGEGVIITIPGRGIGSRSPRRNNLRSPTPVMCAAIPR